MDLENPKVLVVLDTFKKEFFNNEGTLDFFGSKVGKNLYKIITAPRSGLGLSFENINITFAYPQIQEVDRNNAPKPVSLAKFKPFAEKLQSKIKKDKPDLVIGFGKLAGKGMIYSPDKTNYAMEREAKSDDVFKYSENGIDSYYAFMPSLASNSSMMSIPEKDKMIILMNQLKRFLKSGPKGLEPDLGEYEIFTDFSDVKNLFENILPKQKIVACDFETNTLQTWLPGARMITFSCSWKDHQGVAIPLDHKDEHPWNKEQHDQIFKWIVELVERNQFKVFHNAQFDIRAMMDIMGLEYATKVLDTMIFYYIGYSEERSAKKGLKFLSKKYLTLGDYEKPRDEYFAKMQENRYNYWYKAQEEKNAKEAEENGKKPKKVKKSDYQPLVNEVDGSNMNFEWLPLKILLPYAATDTDATLRLFHIFAKKILKNKKWTNLCYTFYPKLVDAICYMEHTGAHFDTEKATGEYHNAYQNMKDKLIDQMYTEVPEIKEYEQHRLNLIAQREQIKKIPTKERTEEQKQFFTEVAKVSGKDSKGIPKYKFTPSSGDKLGYILYNMLGYELPPEKDYLKPASIKKKGLLSHPEKITWDDYKVDSKVSLPYLVDKYNDTLAKLVIRYNEIEKILSSFVDSLPKLACDDFIHATFNITGTTTSRLSSSNPNSQQIPRPSSNPDDLAYHYPIKGLYTSRFKGGYIFNFDYKSLEVFLSALICNEDGLIQALLDGADVHKRNASIAFNTPIDEVKPEQRQAAKKISFGILYGMSIGGLSDSLGESESEAQVTYDKVMSAMPKTKDYIEGVHSFVEKYGYVETIQGNYRRLPEAQHGSYGDKQRALRQSFNAACQGSGPYITNSALIEIRSWLRDNNMKSKLILTVHDSIVVDVHPDEVFEVTKKVKYIMEHLPIKEFILDATGYNVPERWDLGNGKMRFPMFSEIEMGHTYGDDLDWDSDEAKTFPDVEAYYNFSMETKRVNDIYNQKIKEAPDEQKDELEQQRELELHAVKVKYNRN